MVGYPLFKGCNSVHPMYDATYPMHLLCDACIQWVVGWLGGWVVGWLGGWVVGWLASRTGCIAHQYTHCVMPCTQCIMPHTRYTQYVMPVTNGMLGCLASHIGYIANQYTHCMMPITQHTQCVMFVMNGWLCFWHHTLGVLQFDTPNA